jgi:two-component system, NarL family, nitrate/nitrite response regulator NarL
MSDALIRILVADDHVLLREALCDLLGTEPDFDIVAQAGDADTTVELAARHRPDVVLLDVQMPGNDDPARTVQRLLRARPELSVLVVSMLDDPYLVRRLLAAGVRGYVHKSADRQTLAAAVRAQGADRRVVTVSMPPADPHAPGPGSDGHGISEREAEVLSYVAAALSNRQIGARLGITEGTVKRHLRNIFDKLDAVSRIDAVNKATAMSLIPPQRSPLAAAPAPARAARPAPQPGADRVRVTPSGIRRPPGWQPR